MKRVLKNLVLGLGLAILNSCGRDEPAKEESPEAVWTESIDKKWVEVAFGGEGFARCENGVISLDAGAELSGMRYEGEIPTMPYELELEARKVAGQDFFCGLTFPVSSEKECLTFIVGGWGGGTVGISSIDGLDASQNETTTYANFDDDRWYRISVRVEEGKIQAAIDGKTVAEVATAGRELGLRAGMIEYCAPLGLASWQTAAEIRGVRWRTIRD